MLWSGWVGQHWSGWVVYALVRVGRAVLVRVGRAAPRKSNMVGRAAPIPALAPPMLLFLRGTSHTKGNIWKFSAEGLQSCGA